MSLFADIIQASNATLYLTQGLVGNVPVWHYVKIYKQEVPFFLKALKSGTLDVAKFGEVVISGWGKEPPTYIKEHMHKRK